MPLVVAGLRLATVSTIGLVTVSAILGDRFGGLGYYILDGYERHFPTEILIGGLLSIALAILADLGFVLLQRLLTALGGARGDESLGGPLMDIVAATLRWLADPAHWQGPNGIPVRLEEHVALSGVAILLAALVALPLGLWIGHTGRLSWLVVSSANAWRALPSFAVIGLLVPFTTLLDPNLGFTLYPTLVAMIVLAGPPILVNSYQGVAGVDRDLVEAAAGHGHE